MSPTTQISSLQNPRVKDVVRLRQRSHRDQQGQTLVEGFRELKRALDNRHAPVALYVCPSLFLGENEPALIRRCADAGAQIFDCAPAVFEKISYRDRPDGLLAVAPQVRRTLDSIPLRAAPLLVVAQAIEKPGNLGTILRSADGAGADAVIVCDRCTDINNPNVVRASVGTLFAVPVAEAGSAETVAWLRRLGIRILAASPHAPAVYTELDLTGPLALAVGTEQYGLSDTWMNQADLQARIPMLGQADSLNVASATTLILYEAVRQRTAAGPLCAPGPAAGQCGC